MTHTTYTPATIPNDMRGTLNRPRFVAASFRVERMASCRRRSIPRCVSGP